MHPDSLAIVGQVQALVPWLSPQVTAYVAHLILSLPIVAAILGWELVASLLSRYSPAVAAVTSRLAKFSFFLNPLLAALLSALFDKDPAFGLAAGGTWGILNSLVKQASGRSIGDRVEELKVRAAAALLVVGLLLVPGGQARAQEVPGIAYTDPAPKPVAKAGWTSLSNATLAIGLVHDWTRPCFAVQPGWRVPQKPLTVRGRLAWPLRDWARPTQREVGVWLTF